MHKKNETDGKNMRVGLTEVSVSPSAIALVLTELSTMSIQAQARLMSVPSFRISW